MRNIIKLVPILFLVFIFVLEDLKAQRTSRRSQSDTTSVTTPSRTSTSGRRSTDDSGSSSARTGSSGRTTRAGRTSDSNNASGGRVVGAAKTSSDISSNAYGPYVFYSDLTDAHTVVSNACSWSKFQTPTSPYKLHKRARGYGSLNSSKTSCSGRTKKGRSQTKTSGFYILVQDNLDAAGYEISSSNVFAMIEPATVPGCTDSTATNYNSNATEDDNSCTYPETTVVPGCTDSTSFNYDATANTDDGSCVSFAYGCMDSTMFNYDATANTDDGSCVSFAYGCMDSTMFNYDATANTNDGTCVSFAYGCMDSTMFNYDATVNTNDGSCVAVVYGCMDATASNYDATVNTNDGSCADDVVMGCTASSASNYDPTANTDDGTCIRSSFTSADLHNAYGPYILYSDLTAEHTVVSNACSWGSIQVPTSPYNLHPKSRGYGSLNSNKTICSGLTAKNRDQDKTSGFYILVQDNLDAAGYKIGQNNVELVQYAASMVPGCTNVDAPNYDPLAKVDDGSCQDIIYGCTYRSASNYDATANTDDGSCVDVKSIAIRYMDTYGKVYKGHFIKDTDLTDAHTIVSPQMGNKGSKRSKGVPVYHGHKANGQNRTNKLHYDLGICAWDKWTTQDGHVRYEPYQFGKHQPHDSTCDYCYCGWFFGRVFTRTSALGAPDGNGSEYGGEDGLNSATYGCTGWAPNGFGNNNACDNRNRYGTVNGQTFYVVVEDPLGADEYELLTDWSADAWRIIDYVIPEDHDTELDANQYFDWEEWGHYHPGCSTAQYGCRYGLPFID